MFEDVFALRPKMFKLLWKAAWEPAYARHDVGGRGVGRLAALGLLECLHPQEKSSERERQVSWWLTWVTKLETSVMTAC